MRHVYVVKMERNASGMTMAMIAAQAKGMDPADSTPDAIIASEKAGQAYLVASAILPAEMRGITVPELEALGFEIGKQEGWFVEAKLPPGWRKVGSTHDMWSYIHDDTGKQRASIFYKAAWYDTSATLYWDKE